MIKRIFLYSSLVLIMGCASSTGQKTYTENSWKSMIPATCQRFFDGCNNCMRSPGKEIAACTRMYCASYNKPVCLDNKSP